MTYVPKILSGIDAIDKSWGGMFQGASYLCFGHAASGRGLLGMLFLKMGTLLEEKCLLISPRRPQDWMIQAASVDFDLEEARVSGLVRAVWIPSKMRSRTGLDEAAAHALGELVDLIHREAPRRLLIDDFTPFLQFVSFERFRQSFVDLMAQLEDVDTTMLFMMPEAVNMQSKQVIGFMRNHMAGSIHVALKEDDSADNRRVITLLPGIGHVNHEVFENWEIPEEAFSSGRSYANHGRSNLQQKHEKKRKIASQGVRAGTIDSLSDVSMPLVDITPSTVSTESMRALEQEHEAFYEKLRRSFKQRAARKSKPFLLIALRVDPFTLEQQGCDLKAEALLEMLVPAIEGTIKRKSNLLVDPERHRLVAFLPETRPDDVNVFFASLQESLRQQHPDLADQLPHIVSAVVVPDGQPFQNPEDFMAYAMDEH